jgi:hypothetical protein
MLIEQKMAPARPPEWLHETPGLAAHPAARRQVSVPHSPNTKEARPNTSAAAAAAPQVYACQRIADAAVHTRTLLTFCRVQRQL